MNNAIENTSQSLIGFFHRSCLRFPEKPALEVKDQTFSYSQLQAMALNIAATIHDDGPERLVGMMGYRSIEAYASILGILSSGKGYVPLSPKFPVDRTRTMIELSGITDILVEPKFAEKLIQTLETPLDRKIRIYVLGPSSLFSNQPQSENCEWLFLDYDKGASSFEPIVNQQPTDPAYLLFTSGSTGIPKGVMINQKNVCSYISNISKIIETNENDHFSQFFDLTFDLSVHDLFCSWAVGGCLKVIPESMVMAPAQFIIEKEITVWFSVPSLIPTMGQLRMLEPGIFPSIRHSLFCGEPLNMTAAHQWKMAASNSSIHNLYGPTEATIAFTHYLWEEENSDKNTRHGIISIGKPFEGLETAIIDDQNQIVQDGKQGELCLAGDQIAEGYLNDPEKTASQFINIPSTGDQRWYRTGDVVEKNDNEMLIFHGRSDSQVKVQGFRVELQEIEHVLNSIHPGPAIVVPWPAASSGVEALYAFLQGGAASDTRRIIIRCKSKLPHYMIPKKIFFLDNFPLNASGKIDRKALQESLAERL